MNPRLWLPIAFGVGALFLIPHLGTTQPPGNGKASTDAIDVPESPVEQKKLLEELRKERKLTREEEKALKDLSKPPKEEDEELWKQAKKAFEASPEKQNREILKELDKALREPSRKRQEELLEEVRKAYMPTPEQEGRILLALWKAAETPSPNARGAVLAELSNLPPLPPGAVPTDRAEKMARELLQRYDLDLDGLLQRDEAPFPLSDEFHRWDANRDSVIDAVEYRAYIQARAQNVYREYTTESEPPRRSGPAFPSDNNRGRSPSPNGPAESRPELPDWFLRADTDEDTQLALWEWKDQYWPIDGFRQRDWNEDGYVTTDEMLRFLTYTGDRSMPVSNRNAYLARPDRGPAFADASAVALPKGAPTKPDKKEKKADKKEQKSDKKSGSGK